MKSPDGRYELVMHDFWEVRMGSPIFGRIEILGGEVDTSGEFGEPAAFSPDSRFLATEELVDALSGLHTRVVVFGLERRRRIIIHDLNPGCIRGFHWFEGGVLTFETWSPVTGERQLSWQAPPPRPKGLLKNLFG